MKAVITVTGKDTKGIIAKVSSACMERGVNIVDISQSVLQEYFAMIMLVDMAEANVPFAEFADQLQQLGRDHALDVHVIHEDVFHSMHHI